MEEKIGKLDLSGEHDEILGESELKKEPELFSKGGGLRSLSPEEIQGAPACSREEQWLGAIAGLDGVTPPDSPVWHYEQMLAAIYDAAASAADPRPFPARSWHLDEVLYAVYCAIAGLDDPGCPAPTCRIEEFWRGIYEKAMMLDSASIPEPVWRVEEYLSEVFNTVESAGGATTYVSGEAPLTLSDALAKNMKSLKQYGLCTQATTPTAEDPVPIMCNNGELKKSGSTVYVDGTPEVITVNGHTASAESLLSVGDVHDIHDVVSGKVIRCIKSGVYDGTQDIFVTNTGLDTYVSSTGGEDTGAILAYIPQGGKGMNKMWFRQVDNSYTQSNGFTVDVDASTEKIHVHGTNSHPENRPAASHDIFSDGTRWCTVPIVSPGDTFYYSHNFPSSMISQLRYKKSNSTYVVFKNDEAPDGILVSNGKLKSWKFTIPDDFYDWGRLYVGLNYGTTEIDERDLVVEISFEKPDHWTPYKDMTVEQVAPQPLPLADGSNTVSVTANVSPIKLEAVYKGEDS